MDSIKNLLNKLYTWTKRFDWKTRTLVVMCYVTVVALVVGAIVTLINKLVPNDYVRGILQAIWFVAVWYTYIIFGKECYDDMLFDDIAKSCAVGGFTLMASFLTLQTKVSNLFLFGGAGVLFTTFNNYGGVLTYVGYAAALACPYIILYVNRKKAKQKTFYNTKKKKLRTK